MSDDPLMQSNPFEGLPEAAARKLAEKLAVIASVERMKIDEQLRDEAAAQAYQRELQEAAKFSRQVRPGYAREDVAAVAARLNELQQLGINPGNEVLQERKALAAWLDRAHKRSGEK